jgi:protein TonB
MSEDYNDEERGFFQRYGFALGIGAVAVVVGVMVLGHHSGGSTTRTIRPPEVVMIHPVLPTPPPPTPPPEPPKEVVQKMIEQTPMDKPEDKPEPPKDAAPALTTNVVGTGTDAFGLGAGGGGGGGSGGSGGSHSRFGWYAGKVQVAIQAALRRNSITGQAEFSDRIKIWADATGRVSRVRLERSTGSASVDQAISEALEGLQLEEPPPGDMPMPILMRVVARRRI